MLINMTNATEIHQQKPLSIISRFGGFFCRLTPGMGHIVYMVPTNFQQKSVRVVHAHFVPRCM